MAVDEKNTQEPVGEPPVAAGEVHDYSTTLHDHGGDSDLARILGSRHLVMISMGSSIGMGLWLGSGTSLINGGPAGIFLGYCIAGSIAWAVNQCIGELAIMYPVASAFPQWTSKFVDRAPAFTLGWAYWFSYAITLANELQGIVTTLNFWTDKVPTAAWLSIFLVVILIINLFAVTVFGEAEVVMSSIKFFWIFVVIISCIVISAGGAPAEGPIGFRYWNADPFTHGFKGFLAVMSTCIFAMGGTEMGGIVAAEARNPRKAVPRAVSAIWIRLSLFYIMGALMVSITVSPNDPNLFGGSGVNASPFVIAYRNAGIPGLAHAMNAIVFISVLSSGNAQAYGGSRTPIGLAHIGMAPRIFLHADKAGRPWPGIIITFLLGGGLCYLNVSESGANVFTWFSNLTSLCTLYVWGMIFLCHIRFRKAWAAQGHHVSELPWKTWTYPFGSYYGLAWCIVLVGVEFYLAVWPLGEPTTPKNFFANYISVVAILVLYIGAKIYFRGPLYIKREDIDLVSGQRYYADDVEKETHGVKKGVAKFGAFFTGDTKI